MTIAVFGAGAVGAFFGGLLARAGQDVRFLARGAQLAGDCAAASASNPRSSATSRAAASTRRRAAAEVGTVDLVLVCVKAHQTAADCRRARRASARGHGDRHAAERRGVRRGARGTGSDVRASTRQWCTSARPSNDQEWSPRGSRHDCGRRPVVRERHASQTSACAGGLGSAGTHLRRHSARSLAKTDLERELQHGVSRHPDGARRTARDAGDPGAARGCDARSRRRGQGPGHRPEDMDVDDQIAWTERAGAIRTSTMVDQCARACDGSRRAHRRRGPQGRACTASPPRTARRCWPSWRRSTRGGERTKDQAPRTFLVQDPTTSHQLPTVRARTAAAIIIPR